MHRVHDSTILIFREPLHKSSKPGMLPMKKMVWNCINYGSKLSRSSNCWVGALIIASNWPGQQEIQMWHLEICLQSLSGMNVPKQNCGYHTLNMDQGEPNASTSEEVSQHRSKSSWQSSDWPGSIWGGQPQTLNLYPQLGALVNKLNMPGGQRQNDTSIQSIRIWFHKSKHLWVNPSWWFSLLSFPSVGWIFIADYL